MDMRNLYRMAIFARVVEAQSFSRAAAALGFGKSVISQHVLELERSVGVQLINRSPRSFALTDEGRRFYEGCARMTEQADVALTDIATQQTRPHGTIRLTASYNLGLTILISAIADFIEAYPEIRVDLTLDDAIVNVIEEGYDLAFRVGWLRDTSLYAVRMGPFRLILCASAGYLASHRMPAVPADLAEVRWVSITQLPHPDRLELENARGERRSIKVVARIKTNTGLAAREFILRGSAIGIVPDFAVQDALASGQLVRLLPGWSTREGAISAVFPHKELLPPRVRLLLDFLRGRFRTHFDAAASLQ